MREIIDISVTDRVGMPHWPNDVPFTRIQRTVIGQDNAVSNDSVLLMSAHCGTHVDAPRHFYTEGSTVEKIDLNTTVGPCYVLDCTGCDGQITREALSKAPAGTVRLLVKTRNGGSVNGDGFDPDFTGLTVSGAEYLKEQGILLFGSDYFSIGALCDGSIAEDHRIFLSQTGAVALEGLDLTRVDEGCYDLVCLPLKLEGSDGAPCRAILIKDR